MLSLGCDLGAIATKTVLINNGKIESYDVTLNQGRMREAAQRSLDHVLTESGLSLDEIVHRGGTGWGERYIPFEHSSESMIRCLAKGAHWMERESRTVLNIGGLSSTIISMNPDGAQVIEYRTNDRCASGTGFFLELAAQALELKVEELGHVDIVVNNAGITRDRLLMRLTAEDWNQVLAVNLTGAFNFSRVFSPPMLKRRSGCIVNIASVVGQMGNAGQANYAASKAGMIGLTKALAKEFAGRGVRVNAVAPGFIRTAMTESLDRDIREKSLATIPLGRFGEPGDVADVVLFLASDMASYITGQVVNCDGGLIMAR